jgi:hypothetical protein
MVQACPDTVACTMQGFLASVYRLAPPTDRPGERIGSQIDAAHLAAIGEVVRTFGELSRAELIGVETSAEQARPGGAQVADVARITDPEAVAEELDRDGEALVTITVNLHVDDDRVGTVLLSLRLER